MIAIKTYPSFLDPAGPGGNAHPLLTARVYGWPLPVSVEIPSSDYPHPTLSTHPFRTSTITMRLTVLSILAVLSGLGVADPATHILDMLTDLTTLCEDLIVPASQLSVLNAPLLLFGAGPWPV